MNDNYVYKFFHINSKNYKSQILNAPSKKYEIDIEGKNYPETSNAYTDENKFKSNTISSCREFKENDYLNIELALDILKNSYSLIIEEDSKINALSPSAGGLYPIEVYVITSSGHSQPGTYHYSKTSSRLTLIRSAINFDLFLSDSNMFLENASFIIIMTAKMENIINKYGARGYRYALIEVGHIGQNISRYVTEQKSIGCCAIGGFYDDILHKNLNLPENEIPIYIYGIGKKV